MSFYKVLILTFVLVIAGVGSLRADEPATKKTFAEVTGTERLEQVTKDVAAGKYDDFFKESDAKFQELKDTHWFKGLLKQGAEVSENSDYQAFRKDIQELLQQRNDALVALCPESNQERICQRVHSVVGLVAEVKGKLNPNDLSQWAFSEENLTTDLDRQIADIEKRAFAATIFGRTGTMEKYGMHYDLWLAAQVRKWNELAKAIEGQTDAPIYAKAKAAIDFGPMAVTKQFDDMYLKLLANQLLAAQTDTEKKVQETIKKAEDAIESRTSEYVDEQVEKLKAKGEQEEAK